MMWLEIVNSGLCMIVGFENFSKTATECDGADWVMRPVPGDLHHTAHC